MKQENYDANNSITFEVIRYVTLYYFSIAIILTVIQIAFEYQDIKKSIKRDINQILTSFDNSLTNSLWEFNENQTDAIVRGIYESPFVLGLVLEDENGKLLKKLGRIHNPNQISNFSFLEPGHLFSYESKLSKKVNINKSQNVGKITIYSGNQVILEQLSRIIFYVIINSILKTITLWAILILFFNKRVKKPIKTFVTKILDLDPQNPKEIEITSQSSTHEITAMTGAFNNLIKEVQKYKEILEAIIDNKTVQLKEKNLEVRKLISKLEQAQDQLVNQEKLNSLGLVSAGIAHELRNPLNISKNAILIIEDILQELDLTSFAKDEEDKEIIEKITKLVEVVISSNNRMENTIQNMLLQSKPENSDLVKIELHSFVETNLSIVQKSIKNKYSMAVTTQIDIEKDLKLNIFPNEFGRLLVNLIENSFHATLEKYELAQKNKEEYQPYVNIIAKKTNKNEILFTIHDNGVGIPDDIKTNVFDPFFTTKPTGIGTGLGLYLCYEIIKKHKGKLKLNSEENVFTEIQMIFPKNLG